MLYDDQKANLVYDYLYQDARRVASFLSEFETHGVLSQVKSTESASSNESRKSSVSGGIKVAVIGHGEGGQDTTTSSELRDGAERTYDPILKYARNLLDFLSDQEMICRDLSSARIGQFVLASGSLGILDVKMLDIIWEIPVFREMAEKSISTGLEPSLAGLSKTQQGAARIQSHKQAKSMIDLIRKLPNTVQARMSTNDDFSIYSSLQSDGLIGSTVDILLKNGIKVPGEWSMLGILDALPDQDGEDLIDSNMISGPFGSLLNKIVPLARQFSGRPSHAFGVTPLLIFRAVVT